MFSRTELENYKQVIDNTNPLFDLNQAEYSIPIFKKIIICGLFKEATNLLLKIPTLVNVKGPVVIVGDIHGNLRDLIRIIRMNGMPSKINYVFLGDYIDRGQFSIEVLTLLLALQVLYPDNVFLLRGNHETRVVSASYGFKQEVEKCYGDDEIYDLSQYVFDNMSLAAIINDKIFCVHGGISGRIQTIKQISELRKPIIISEKDEISNLVNDILWSDPSDVVSYFGETVRGYGVQFGIFSTKNFLENNNLKAIVRGHSVVSEGIKRQFTGLLYTVFSSGSYHPSICNRPGFLIIEEENRIKAVTLPQMPQFNRKNVSFTRAVECSTLAGLNSGRRIGPGVMNCYWSSPRRNSDTQTTPKNPLPPFSNSPHLNEGSYDRKLMISPINAKLSRRMQVRSVAKTLTPGQFQNFYDRVLQ